MKMLFSISFIWIAAASFAAEGDAPRAPVAPTESVVSRIEAPKPQKRLSPAQAPYAKSRFTMDKSEAEADRRPLILAAGIDKIVDLDPNFKMSDKAQAIMVGNTQVVAVVPVTIGQSKQLIFKPVAEGETNVTLRDKAGFVKVIFDVVVAKQNLVKYLERIQSALREVEGISVGIEDQKIVIRGEVLSPNDYSQIVNEVGDKTYGEAVINKVTMSPVTIAALAKKIESDVQVFAPTVRVSVLNGKIILEGSVDTEAIKTRAFKRAYWYLPPIRISDPLASASNAALPDPGDKNFFLLQNDISVVPPPPKRESKLVRLSVYFVELSKDFLKAFGFKWQPGFTADPSITIGSDASGGTTTSGGGGFTFSGTLSSLFPAFAAPPSNASYGRILKSATVIVKSEKEAHVKDTVQIPTQTVGQNGTTGNGPPATVGFDAKITPTILQGQDVDLDISLSQSNQIGRGQGGVPITASHEIGTRLYLKSGEVGAVVAVNKQDISTSFNRDDPNAGSFSGSTRPLFTLHRSKNMTKAKGQFVVFVSPLIVENASEGTEDLKKNFRMPSSSSR